MYLLISKNITYPLYVKFKGLIACGRVYPKYGGRTFITIGYNNNRFIDLTLDGKHFYHKYHWISGDGYLKNYLDDYYVNNNQADKVEKTKLIKKGLKNNALMIQVTNFEFGWL